MAMTFALAACGSSSSSAGKDAAPSAPAASAGSGATPAASSTDTGSVPSGKSGAQSTGGYDFCQLITSAEAETMLGTPVKLKDHSSSKNEFGLLGQCGYQSTDYPSKSASMVHVIYLGNKMSRAQYDQDATAIWNGEKANPAPGLGETAAFLDGQMVVFDHGAELHFQMIKHGVVADLAELTGLARQLLARVGDVR